MYRFKLNFVSNTDADTDTDERASSNAGANTDTDSIGITVYGARLRGEARVLLDRALEFDNDDGQDDVPAVSRAKVDTHTTAPGGRRVHKQTNGGGQAVCLGFMTGAGLPAGRPVRIAKTTQWRCSRLYSRYRV